MALLASASGNNRPVRVPLLTALLLALVGVALLTSGAWSRGTQPPSDNAAAGGNAVTTGSSSTAKQQKAGANVAARWAGVPAVSLSQQVPSWAGCPQIPCDYGEMVDGPSDTTVPYSSQFGEDAWLFRNVFHNKLNGTYLEMGAMNGVDLSNTRWFMQAAGWKGLLIEACPAMAAELQRNRRESISVHAAVCGDFRTVHWHSSGNVGGIFEFMAEGFKAIFHKDLKVETLPEVPCVPMQFLLDKFGIGSLDLWSLDGEGAELEILKTVDFSRLSVKVLMVELDGHNKEKDQAVTDLLAAVGFAPLRKTQQNDMNNFNTVFVHKDAWPQLAHHPEVKEVTQ